VKSLTKRAEFPYVSWEDTRRPIPLPDGVILDMRFYLRIGFDEEARRIFEELRHDLEIETPASDTYSAVWITMEVSGS
jgi:hypothetical protein